MQWTSALGWVLGGLFAAKLLRAPLRTEQKGEAYRVVFALPAQLTVDQALEQLPRLLPDGAIIELADGGVAATPKPRPVSSS